MPMRANWIQPGIGTSPALAQSDGRMSPGAWRHSGSSPEGESLAMNATQPASGERAFAFLQTNGRAPKPRTNGLTEIRGPYYTPMGKRYLEDILETMGTYVDILKFAGGSFTLMPYRAVKEVIDLCHAHKVLVSTGGFIEYVLAQGSEAVNRYL